MKILVTGSNGFMASELIRQANSRGLVTFGVSRKTHGELWYKFPYLHVVDAGYDDIAEIIRKCDIDIIYHFAANPLVSATENIIESNVVLTDKICRASIGRKLVFASSVSVYGCKQKTFTLDDPVDPETLYAVTKVQSEELIKFYCKRGLNATCIRYVTNVGRGSTHGVLPDIISKIKDSIHDRFNVIEVFGEYPGSCKPYLHVADAMKATLDIDIKPGFNVINMSPDDNICVSDIINIVQEQLDTSVSRYWNPNRVWQGDQKYFRVKSDIKFRPSKEAIIMATKELI
jgi:nucleoside-diphosphate-sugar epimerase